MPGAVVSGSQQHLPRIRGMSRAPIPAPSAVVKSRRLQSTTRLLAVPCQHLLLPRLRCWARGSRARRHVGRWIPAALGDGRASREPCHWTALHVIPSVASRQHNPTTHIVDPPFMYSPVCSLPRAYIHTDVLLLPSPSPSPLKLCPVTPRQNRALGHGTRREIAGYVGESARAHRARREAGRVAVLSRADAYTHNYVHAQKDPTWRHAPLENPRDGCTPSSRCAKYSTVCGDGSGNTGEAAACVALGPAPQLRSNNVRQVLYILSRRYIVIGRPTVSPRARHPTFYGSLRQLLIGHPLTTPHHTPHRLSSVHRATLVYRSKQTLESRVSEACFPGARRPMSKRHHQSWDFSPSPACAIKRDR